MKPLTLFDPASIGPYRLLGVLGSGGMGRVYLGRSPSGRLVAIKVVRTDLMDDPATRRRFVREAAAARTVSPLFTAAVVDADVEGDPPWLATTYIEGPSLERWVDQHGALAPAAGLTLAAGLAEAVASIHRAGLIHRDIKPANVLLGATGPHVIDFGLVRGHRSTMMSLGRPVGTPSYMAPECIHGAEAGPPADVFSLGATLVFATTGRSLVESEQLYAQIMQIVAGRFELSGVPGGLRPLVARCLSPHPEDRPTAAELVGVLTAGGMPVAEPGWYGTAGPDPLDPGPRETTPRETTPRDAMPRDAMPEPPGPARRFTRRRLLAAGAAAGVAAVGGGGTWLIVQDRAGERSATAGPHRPGTVLWLARSGAPATAGVPGATRILPRPDRRIVAAGLSEVYAQTVEGRREWTQPLPDRFVDARAGRDAVLVAHRTGVRTFDPAAGALQAAVSVPGPVRQMVSAAGRAFAHGPTETVALDGVGRPLWRAAVGSPLAADATWLLTHDRSGATARVGLRDAATGRGRWTTAYQVPATPPPGPPPGLPPGGPDGAPPMADVAWSRTEAILGAGFVALRHGPDVQVLRLADGRQVWRQAWPRPIAALAVAGDLLLIGADRLTALELATGAEAWQSALRGARMTVSGGGTTVVAAERTVTALDSNGVPLWQTDLPSAVGHAVPDQVSLDGATAFVTFKPVDPRVAGLDVDVVAFVLAGP